MLMNNFPKLICPLCEYHVELIDLGLSFQNCAQCGIQIAFPPPESGILTNQSINSEFHQDGLLQREQAKIARNSTNLLRLVDLGCSSGRFMLACKRSRTWNQVFGVEPDSLSRRSAIDNGFDVFESLDQLSRQYSLSETLYTMWHSLEHFAANDIDHLFTLCASEEQVEFLIAVPNSDSFLFKRFGRSWAYYDDVYHFFQFNIPSLSFLASKHGFAMDRLRASFSYEVFAIIQTILNTSTSRPRNYIYSQVKRNGSRLSFRDMIWSVTTIIRHPLLLSRACLALFSWSAHSVLIVKFSRR